jgi:hypothetical protein
VPSSGDAPGEQYDRHACLSRKLGHFPARADIVRRLASCRLANGSQFFITHKPTAWLQGKHTIFGQIHDKASQDVVNTIEKGDVIKTITIQEKPE